MNKYFERAVELVSKMTLEEKAGLCSGADCWHTKAIERLGLPSIMLSDGPHGLRKQIGATDNLGIGDSVPAVCFPTASALACSFDRDLLFEVGQAIGEACVQEGVSVLLGPGVNQKRSPLCGRNFEYFSEDPVVSGELGASMIQGIQSTGTSACLKHFAVNNQETRRMTISAVIDERTLRETYLKSFEIAVKKGCPDTLMCSYNRLNGVYCSENKYLLQDILRDEWQFQGVTISDWGAVHDRVLGVKSGLDLEMPGNQGYNDKKLVQAVQNVDLAIESLNQSAINITALVLKATEKRRVDFKCDEMIHHRLSVKASEESMVLLKNEDKLLPGNVDQKVAIIGHFAKQPRYQGAGSSKIHPIKIDNPYDALINSGITAEFSNGYMNQTSPDKKQIESACEIAKQKDIVYIFAGLSEGYESEGFDRKDLSLPQDQNELIEAVCKCNKNVVVILMGGAPVEMPWINDVKSVLLAYLGGEGVGQAIANILLGKAVPCGKLAETWPLSVSDTPANHYFPGNRLTVEYRESIYVGYRYYDKANRPVRFHFGHGLSYSAFEYSNLKLDRENCNFGESVNLSLTVKNAGPYKCKETIFIFSAFTNSCVFLPEKELIEFTKITLEPGEVKVVTVFLDTNQLGYFNTETKKWYAECGAYHILAGPSSNQCLLSEVLHIRSAPCDQPDYKNEAGEYYQLSKGELVIRDQSFKTLYGKEIPKSALKANRPYNLENTLEDVSRTLIGKILIKVADKMARKISESEVEQEGMMVATIKQMPFFSLIASSEGVITDNRMAGILELLNGHYFKGIRTFFKKT